MKTVSKPLLIIEIWVTVKVAPHECVIRTGLP